MSDIQNKEQEEQDNKNYSKNFTRIPNILFVSYKHLSKEEKFLYCTLRQVYWDARPRFVSLRDLSGLTGYSLGALSKMLPRLNTCGLIHTEIRKERGRDGKEKGNSKYHITIPDIWELNREYFSCSLNERVDPSQKLVHQMVQASSPNEQASSPNGTSEFTKSDKVVPFGELDQAQNERAKDSSKTSSKTSSKKGRKKRGYSHSSTPSQPPSQESFSEEKPEEVVEFSPEEQAVYDFGRQTIFKAKPPKKTPYVKEQCAEIAKAGIKTLDQMKTLVVLTKQETGFKTLHLGNLINALNGWLLTQQLATDLSLNPPTAKSGTAHSSYDDDGYVDDTFYPTREVTHAAR